MSQKKLQEYVFTVDVAIVEECTIAAESLEEAQGQLPDGGGYTRDGIRVQWEEKYWDHGSILREWTSSPKLVEIDGVEQEDA